MDGEASLFRLLDYACSWLGRNRRLAKDGEAIIASATAWRWIASI